MKKKIESIEDEEYVDFEETLMEEEQDYDGVCRALPCGLMLFSDFLFLSAKEEVRFVVQFLFFLQLLSYF